jgi:hypothetical protein
VVEGRAGERVEEEVEEGSTQQEHHAQHGPLHRLTRHHLQAASRLSVLYLYNVVKAHNFYAALIQYRYQRSENLKCSKTEDGR